MKRNQKNVLLSFIAAIALMSIFPPWQVATIHYFEGQPLTGETTEIQFRYIFSDPNWRTGREAAQGRIRFDILSVEIFVIALVGTGIVLYLKRE